MQRKRRRRRRRTNHNTTRRRRRRRNASSQLKKHPWIWDSPPGYPPLQENWGGFMPFPPEDCIMREKAGNALIKSRGVEWIDNVICAFRCPKICTRRKEFEQEAREKAKAGLVQQYTT